MHLLNLLLVPSLVKVLVNGAPLASSTNETADALVIRATSSWSCTVPAGYTYDSVQSVFGTCGAALHPYYHILLPSDEVSACTVPEGFVYDSVANSLDVCSTSGFAPRYHLRVPSHGLACYTVPAGWTFASTQETLDVCSIFGFAAEYRLK
ncbi:hypothetical protein N431DRAFT_454463 [Stipitochalara longipes BDJ]|nr:hypothetical protein N431DRAFT_454463 [Stipitochalara longipes BDJ]